MHFQFLIEDRSGAELINILMEKRKLPSTVNLSKELADLQKKILPIKQKQAVC